jgi:hypothetical protein
MTNRVHPGRTSSTWTSELARPNGGRSRTLFLGRRDGSIREHAPWLRKESHLLGVAPALIEIDHTPRREWFRVRDRVEVRVSAPVPEQPTVTCVVSGHDRAGEELTVETLRVTETEQLQFEYRGVCAYASTFEYSGS